MDWEKLPANSSVLCALHNEKKCFEINLWGEICLRCDLVLRAYWPLFNWRICLMTKQKVKSLLELRLQKCVIKGLTFEAFKNTDIFKDLLWDNSKNGGDYCQQSIIHWNQSKLFSDQREDTRRFEGRNIIPTIWGLERGWCYSVTD